MNTNSAYNSLSANQKMYTPLKQSQLALSSLLSPPEPKRQSSFQPSPPVFMSRHPSSSANCIAPQYTITMSKQTPSLISPPVSPQTAAKEQGRRDEEDGMKDPVLFPSSQDMTVAAEPLFSQVDAIAVERIDKLIDEHMAAKSVTGVVSGPPAEDYRVVIQALSQIRFQSSVQDAIRKVSPQIWTRDEIKWEKYYMAQGPQKDKKKLTSPSYKPLAPAPAGVHKSRVTIPRTKNQPKTKRVRQTPEPISLIVPESTPPPPNTPRAAKNSAFFNNWAQLPDYCPPFPDNFGSKSLKTDWKGAALDLSNDMFRHELHPAELNLASTLRLGCAMYLTSKRQIFAARRDALKIGKEFRKTDAQQATNIDVNKASKLWTAFEKVGWFNEEHFR